MTAVDAAVQSKLLGAEQVTMVYRRGKAQMNASEFEQDLAAAKGVTIRHWLAPKRVLLTGGKLSGLELSYMSLDATGALRPTGETTIIACDQIFKAIGQTLATDGEGVASRAARSRSMPRVGPRWPRSGRAAIAPPAATI